MKRKTFIKKLANLIASTASYDIDDVTGKPYLYAFEAAELYAEGVTDLLVKFEVVALDAKTDAEVPS